MNIADPGSLARTGCRVFFLSLVTEERQRALLMAVHMLRNSRFCGELSMKCFSVSTVVILLFVWVAALA
jgi:hypothetical protein